MPVEGKWAKVPDAGMWPLTLNVQWESRRRFGGREGGDVLRDC